ncbi:MAG: hypothetical protein V4726_16685 [Verrucomicrobiota bacterium]
MNLEMPTPAETESLRKLLLIVLGVMIVTIPVIGILVVAKIKARQRAYRPPGADRSTGVPPVSSQREPEGLPRTDGSPDTLSGSSDSETRPPSPHA